MPDGFAQLTPGTKVEGLVPDAVVEILDITPAGSGVFVRYRDDFGIEDSGLFSADEMKEVQPVGGGGPTLDADPDQFRLAIEALRLRHAPLLNPLLAVSSSNVEAFRTRCRPSTTTCSQRTRNGSCSPTTPAPARPSWPGLFIKEAMARGWVRRCLIVVPGSLAEQWQDELSGEVRTPVRDLREHRSSAIPQDETRWPSLPLPDRSSRPVQPQPGLMELASTSTYDLAIFDEAHKLTASTWGSKVIKSKRFEFGEAMRDAVPSLLLMTATPHNGKDADYQQFLSLLREAGQDESVAEDPAHDGLMRRLVKEQLVHLDGSPLVPRAPRQHRRLPAQLDGAATSTRTSASTCARR